MALYNDIPLKRLVFDTVISTQDTLDLIFGPLNKTEEETEQGTAQGETIYIGARVPNNANNDVDEQQFYNFTPYDCKNYSSIKIAGAGGFVRNAVFGTSWKNKYLDGTYKVSDEDTSGISSSYRYSDYITTSVVNGLTTNAVTSGKTIMYPRLGEKEFNFNPLALQSNFRYKGIKSFNHLRGLFNCDRWGETSTATLYRNIAIEEGSTCPSKCGLITQINQETTTDSIALETLKYPLSYIGAQAPAAVRTVIQYDFKNDSIENDIDYPSASEETGTPAFNSRIRGFPKNMDKVHLNNNTSLNRLYEGLTEIKKFTGTGLPTDAARLVTPASVANLNLNYTFKDCSQLTDLTLWSGSTINSTLEAYANTQLPYRESYLGTTSNTQTFKGDTHTGINANSILTFTAGTTYNKVFENCGITAVKAINLTNTLDISKDQIVNVFEGTGNKLTIGAISVKPNITAKTGTSLFSSTRAVKINKYIPGYLYSGLSGTFDVSTCKIDRKHLFGGVADYSKTVSKVFNIGGTANIPTIATLPNTSTLSLAITNTKVDKNITQSWNISQQTNSNFTNSIQQQITAPSGFTDFSISTAGIVKKTCATIKQNGSSYTNGSSTLSTYGATIAVSDNTLTLTYTSAVNNINDDDRLGFASYVEYGWSAKVDNTPVYGISYISMNQIIPFKHLNGTIIAIYTVNPDGTLSREFNETDMPITVSKNIGPYTIGEVSVTSSGNVTIPYTFNSTFTLTTSIETNGVVKSCQAKIENNFSAKYKIMQGSTLLKSGDLSNTSGTLTASNYRTVATESADITMYLDYKFTGTITGTEDQSSKDYNITDAGIIYQVFSGTES